jgi:hypothetical protein
MQELLFKNPRIFMKKPRNSTKEPKNFYGRIVYQVPHAREDDSIPVTLTKTGSDHLNE